MNTRLQVEHPVTEAITGQDLVEWQLRVASGEPLPLAQDELSITGHAFEARVYAEDAAAGFLPAIGRVTHLDWPEHDAFALAPVRVDSGVRAGDEISPHYDPMIAKVIVHETDRASALAALGDVLGETVIAGVTTNLGFLGALAHHGGFAAGVFDTGLIGRDLDALVGPEEPPDAVLAAAGLGVLGLLGRADPDEVWKMKTGWRAWGAAEQDARLERGGVPLAVKVAMAQGGMSVNGQAVTCAPGSRWDVLRIDGRLHEMAVLQDGDGFDGRPARRCGLGI